MIEMQWNTVKLINILLCITYNTFGDIHLNDRDAMEHSQMNQYIALYY